MADLKPISQFATASSVEANTLLFVSTPNQNNGYDSEKVSAGELGEALVNDFEYTQDLSTVSKKVTGAINENKSVIGYSYDEYDDTTTSANAYAVDDFCIRNNTLYKCIAPTYGAWDSSKWESTSIADEIGRIDTALSNLTITDITDSIGTTPTGITLVTSESAVYKQGKHIFGTLLFKSTNDLVVNTDNLLITIATAYKASRIQNFFGVTSNSQYNIANACYAYLSTSQQGSCEISVKAPSTTQKYAKVQIDYITF